MAKISAITIFLTGLLHAVGSKVKLADKRLANRVKICVCGQYTQLAMVFCSLNVMKGPVPGHTAET